MYLRLAVFSLITINILLWGWVAVLPEAPGANGQAANNAPPIGPVPGLANIRLAREMNLAARSASEGARQCFTLGPVSSRSVLRELQDELELTVVQLSWRETTAMVEQGYWVYLEPFNNFDQASDAVTQLLERGITDYYIVPRGEYANAISLGIYEREPIARQRMMEIEALDLGWPVSMGMRRQHEPRYWLDFETRGGADIAFGALLSGMEGAQHLEVQCDANETSFPPT